MSVKVVCRTALATLGLFKTLTSKKFRSDYCQNKSFSWMFFCSLGIAGRVQYLGNVCHKCGLLLYILYKLPSQRCHPVSSSLSASYLSLMLKCQLQTRTLNMLGESWFHISPNISPIKGTGARVFVVLLSPTKTYAISIYIPTKIRANSS